MRVARHYLLALAVAATLGGAFVFPRMAQDIAYHVMADRRTLLGVPNCLNVLSNAPFAVVGIMGIAAVFRSRAFRDPWERWPYWSLFGGTALTAFGSAYYHLAPDNARLVWDRLPMTLGFMGLLAAMFTERLSPRVGRLLFGPLLVLGAASVGYWHWGEIRGAGDLRLYIFVQFGSLLLVLLLLFLYPSRYTGAPYLFIGLAAYAAAKLLELADRPIFALGKIVSGHTLKHLAAAVGVAFVAAMFRVRQAKPTPIQRNAL